MTREVDGHSDPCTQSVARPAHHQGDYHWWDLRCSQMRTLK